MTGDRIGEAVMGDTKAAGWMGDPRAGSVDQEEHLVSPSMVAFRTNGGWAAAVEPKIVKSGWDMDDIKISDEVNILAEAKGWFISGLFPLASC